MRPHLGVALVAADGEELALPAAGRVRVAPHVRGLGRLPPAVAAPQHVVAVRGLVPVRGLLPVVHVVVHVAAVEGEGVPGPLTAGGEGHVAGGAREGVVLLGGRRPRLPPLGVALVLSSEEGKESCE